MTQQDWKARQEDLLDLNDPEAIEEEVLARFKELPLDRQIAVLSKLSDFLPYDDPEDDGWLVPKHLQD